MKSEKRIWYKKSADDFDSALPVGNGRMGAMVYGRAIDEIISLNEDSIWSGGLRNRNNPDAYNGMLEVRKLIDEGNLKEAEKIAFYKMQGISSNSRSFMPLGNLFIHMQNYGKVREYTRELDLQRAMVNTQYSLGGVQYLRQVFISYPDNVIVVHFHSEEKGKISFTANIDGREGLYDDNRPCSENTIMYTGGSGGENGINFALYMTAVADGGKVETLGSKLVVTDADEATILISVGSSFYDEMYKESALMDLEYAAECDYGELMYRHIEDYSALFNRVEFELDDSEDYVSKLPTNERLERLHGSEFDDKECVRDITDPGFVTLFYNYARYLMISASRPNSQPMNLQGLWNEDMRPRWGSRYTINVNTEMAYWPAEICNLSECHLPLFDLIERVRENGKITAQEMYHCRGFVAHDNTDIWGDTAPQGMYVNSTLWPMGAAWLCLHIYQHYEFTGDVEFLESKYETMKEAALFFVDFLVEDEEGRLITTPTVSPENSYKNEMGNTGSICKGATMDSQIIRALFTYVCKASEILGKDKDFALKLKEIIAKLPETQVGKYGQIQEWSHDYDEVEVGHRHVSQLFGLFPENEISQIKTPKLANAARATLIRRLIYKDGHFGWNYAWTMNMWARLFDGQMAYENLQKMFLFSLSSNLLNNYPPFQIDANMGIAAGITEMFMQSCDGEIHLLPALPDNWKNGRIKGIKAKGGFEVSIIWKDSKLEKAEITSILGNECKIRYKNPISVEAFKSDVYPKIENDLICFETKENTKYIIKG